MDGKTIRGARAGDGRAVPVLAAMLAGSRTVIAPREIAAKINEITAFAPPLAGQDLSGVLVSADALHTQRAHARFLVEDKNADYLLVVTGHQPGLFHPDDSRAITQSTPLDRPLGVAPRGGPRSGWLW